jgi:hypothetical protein
VGFWIGRARLSQVNNNTAVDERKGLRIMLTYGFGLRYINKQTEELCIAAVKNNPLAIQFVHEQTQAIQKIVIDSRNSAAIDMLDNLDRSIEAHLVSLKPKKIERIKNVLIQYENYNLCVLESFNSGNAFYCFNTGKFSDIEKDLVSKTKVQLFSHPLLIKRGYHSSDMFNLMLNVNSLF